MQIMEEKKYWIEIYSDVLKEKDMSKLFDAKHEALSAYPNDEEAAIDLFVRYVGMSKSDIEYELGESVRDYIFGKPNSDV